MAKCMLRDLPSPIKVLTKYLAWTWTITVLRLREGHNAITTNIDPPYPWPCHATSEISALYYSVFAQFIILLYTAPSFIYRVIVSSATKTFANILQYIALKWLLCNSFAIVTYRHLIFSVKQHINMPNKLWNSTQEKGTIFLVGSNWTTFWCINFKFET